MATFVLVHGGGHGGWCYQRLARLMRAAAWMAERLTGHPWQCFEQPLALTNEDALWAIPQFHIVCTSTPSAIPR